MSSQESQADLIPVECEEFIACFCETFISAYHKMTVEVVSLANKKTAEDVGSVDVGDECVEGTWRVCIAETHLRPHVCHVLKQDFSRDRNLDDTRNRLRKTRVDHVQWAGAVLLVDEAASRALLYILKTKVASAICRQFGSQSCAIEAIEDLPSHVLMAGNKSENSRLSGYRGLAALDSWLVGIGINFAYNKCKRKRTISLDDQASSDHQFFPQASRVDSHAIERPAADLRRRLIEAIADTLPLMTDQERLLFWLVWIMGYKPSQAAEYLGVSKPRISQILASIREKIAETADDVLTDMSRETGYSKEDLAKLLNGLMVCVSHIEEKLDIQILNGGITSEVGELTSVVMASCQATDSTVKAR